MDLNTRVCFVSSVPSPLLTPRTDPLHRSIPPLAQILRSLLRKCTHPKVQIQGSDALLGLDKRYCQRSCDVPASSWGLSIHSDAADFEHSSFFDTSSNGVGGWGDPKNDFQIYNGGFKDVVRVYPNPHHVRRNFSLFPFTNPLAPPPWGDAPDGPPANLTFMVNTTMTQANVDSVVNGYEGNYMQMQAYFDSTNVSPAFVSTVPWPS